MEDRINHDAPRLNHIEDYIRKSANEGTPVVGQHCRIHLRVSLHGKDRRLHTPYELQTQPGTLPLVPGKAVGQILPGRREKVRLFSPLTQEWTS